MLFCSICGNAHISRRKWVNGKENRIDHQPKLNGDTDQAGEHTKYIEENFIMLNVFNFGLLSIFISRKSGRQRLF